MPGRRIEGETSRSRKCENHLIDITLTWLKDDVMDKDDGGGHRCLGRRTHARTYLLVHIHIHTYIHANRHIHTCKT